MTERFIPTEEIARLVAGSYEAQIAGLTEAITSDRERLFGKGVQRVKVIATFKDRAVAMAEDGRFVNVRFEMSATGVPTLVEHEALAVRVIEEKDLPGFVHSQASKAVDACMSGDESRVQELIAGLLRVAPTRPAIAEDRIVESVRAELAEIRPWQKVYEQRLPRIQATLKGESLALLDQSKIEPKYRKIYDGSMLPLKVEGFRGLVQSDLNYLKERVTALYHLVSVSLSSAKRALQTKDLSEEESAKTFSTLAEDLLVDTKRLVHLVTEGAAQVHGVAEQGRLYDAIVARLPQQETAGMFVRIMAERLIAASKQGRA